MLKSKHLIHSTNICQASVPVPGLNSGSTEANKTSPVLDEMTF